jgi:hypothetical protein
MLRQSPRSLPLRLALAIAVLSLASPAFADMTPAMPALSNAQVESLNGGEIITSVVEGATPEGDAMGVVNASAETIARILEDFAAYPQWMEDQPTAEVRSEENGVRRCYGVTDTPWPMDDRDWEVFAQGGPQQMDGVDVILLTWQHVPGTGNVVDTQGYWLLIPWGADGSQTLVRYRLRVDLGTWLPDFLMSWATENFLPNKIENLRSRVATLAAQ